MTYKFGTTFGKKNYLRNGLILLAGLALFAVFGLMGLNNWYETKLVPVDSNAHEISFVIEPGESTADIALRLESEGLIRHAGAFTWYVGRQKSSLIQAGSYRLAGFLSAKDIANILLTGQVETDLVTIPPGLRLDQIRTVLTNAGFTQSEVDQAFGADYDNSVLRYKPTGASLEGYIYPESLQITASSSVKEILNSAFKVFEEQLTPTILDGIRQQKLSVHEAIILASIIQEEVSDPQEQRTVAQVFLKRLAEGMALGADPTFKYAAAVYGLVASPSLDNPYNTRIYAGLPPGPIANFTISALEAVANPTDTDYLYFVSGDNGITYFSYTFSEHQANIDKYCKELCKL